MDGGNGAEQMDGLIDTEVRVFWNIVANLGFVLGDDECDGREDAGSSDGPKIVDESDNWENVDRRVDGTDDAINGRENVDETVAEVDETVAEADDASDGRKVAKKRVAHHFVTDI